MKIVGISPLYDKEKESIWMLPNYLRMLEAYQVSGIILPLTNNKDELDSVLKLCDGFLITGGQDVNPRLYNEKISEKCGEISEVRDFMDSYILKYAMKKDIPLLGICRGAQIMNASMGGTLYQDLESEYGSNTNHHMDFPYDREVHKVKIITNSLLEKILNKELIGVNSYHHQAIKKLSSHFLEAGISDDGLVEAIYSPKHKFILGVQWHPEYSFLKSEDSRSIIKAFTDEIKKS